MLRCIEIDMLIWVHFLAAGQSNGLSRSRRSHFSRKDSTPEAAASSKVARGKNENATAVTVSSDSSK